MANLQDDSATVVHYNQQFLVSFAPIDMFVGKNVMHIYIYGSLFVDLTNSWDSGKGVVKS